MAEQNNNDDVVASLLEKLNKNVEKGIFGSGNKKITSSVGDIDSFRSQNRDLNNKQEAVLSKLEDIVSRAVDPNSSIKDQYKSLGDITSAKTALELMDQQDDNTKQLMSLVSRVEEGVRQNTNTTRTTAKFVSSKVVDATVALGATAFDSPLFAAVGAVFSDFMNFRKEKKEEAYKLKNQLIQEDIKENIARSIDEQNNQSKESIDNEDKNASEVVTQVKDSGDMVEYALVEISKLMEDVVASNQLIAEAAGLDTKEDNNDIVEIRKNTQETRDSVNQLVEIEKDAAEQAKRMRMEALENARESSRIKLGGNKGKGKIDEIEEEGFFEKFLGIADFLQGFKAIFSMLGKAAKALFGIAAFLGKSGFKAIGLLRGAINSTLGKLLLIPAILGSSIVGGIEGWKESEGQRFSQRLIETLQSSMGKLLEFFSFGMLNEESLENASAALSESGMLDPVFKIVSASIDSILGIFEFINEKLDGVKEFLGLSDETIEERANKVRRENEIAQMKGGVREIKSLKDLEALGLVDRDFFGDDDIDLDNVKERVKSGQLKKSAIQEALNDGSLDIDSSDREKLEDIIMNMNKGSNASSAIEHEVKENSSTKQVSNSSVTNVDSRSINTSNNVISGDILTTNKNDSLKKVDALI